VDRDRIHVVESQSSCRDKSLLRSLDGLAERSQRYSTLVGLAERSQRYSSLVGLAVMSKRVCGSGQTGG
jgi:hypothetical protein